MSRTADTVYPRRPDGAAAWGRRARLGAGERADGVSTRSLAGCPRRRAPWATIARVLPDDVRARLRKQLGLVARRQLIHELGRHKGEIEGWLRRGHLEVAHCRDARLVGTYRSPTSARSPEQALLAAALRCGPEAWVTGEAALGLLGLEDYSPRASFRVLVPPTRWVRNVPFAVDQDPLYTEHRASAAGIPITRPARSIVEAARTVTSKRVRTTVDQAVWRSLLSIPELRACAGALGHEGARVVREMVDSGVFEQESEGERALKPVLAGLDPPPIWQYYVGSGIRVDCCLADVPLVIEYCGEEAHALPHLREQDHERTRAIQALGYTVLEVWKHDLKHPEVLRARVLGIREGLLATRR